MKKKWFLKDYSYLFSYVRKIVKIMRLSIFLVVLTSLQSLAISNYAQSGKINVKVENKTVSEVLQLIERESDFFLFYNNKVADLDEVVTLDLTNKTVLEVLDILFKDKGVTYTITNKQIVLSKTAGKNSLKNSVQQKTVSGKVIDASGLPLPGVTVVIKGTTQGTVTNSNGEYTLTEIKDDAVVQFSFVGMKSQEISVIGKNIINVTMTDESIGIEEVVAIGYGTMKKSDLTGTVTRIDNTMNEVIPNSNVIQVLNGAIPGVSISAGGNAGSGSSISIRGQNSISAGGSALIVLDGIIYNGQIGNLNPNDIESIDVLRDASSAAIFGSRAANGVILITTKRGKTAKPTIQVNSEVGIQDILMTQDLETTDQYTQKRFDYQRTLAYRGVSPEPDMNNPVTFLNDAEIDNYLAGKTIDAYDKVSRIAPIQNYNISLSANTGNTNYFVSGSWTDQKGVIMGDQFKRASIRINLESKVTDWLTIGTNSSFAYVDVSGAKADIHNAFQLSPYATWYLDEAETILNPIPMTDGLIQNPLMPTLNKIEKNRKDLFCTAYSEIKLPFVEGLTYRFSYSNNLGFSKNYTFVPSFTEGGWDRAASSSNILTESQDMTLENLIKYKRVVSDIHSLDLTLLYNYNSISSNTLTAKANTFPTEVLDWYSLSLGENQTTDAGYSDYHSIGMMARLNYIYKGKYLMTVTGRRDGASVFSKNNKFAFFPSVALGWTISEEDFLKDNNVVDFLKVRYSYGANGNQAISRYQSLSVIQTGYNYLFDGNTAYGIAKTSMGNSDLKWETTYASNLGIDFELLNNRISGNVNLYNSNTKDLLLRRSIPSLNGFKSILSNLGEVNNKGLEVMLRTVNVKQKDWEWTTSFNLAKNNNKIVKLYGNYDENGVEEDDISNSWFIGKSLGAFYGYETVGVWQIDDDIPNGFRPGDFKIADLNDDGQITPEYDRKILGYDKPDWTFGFSSSLSYKNFTLYAVIKGAVGGVRNAASMFDPSSAFNYRMHDQYIQWWTPDNPSATIPSMDYQDSYNVKWLQSVSYTRIQDLSLSYNFGEKTLRKLNMSSFQVFVSSKNPFLFSDWGGWDPETTGSGKGQYPSMKSLVLGVNFGL